MSRLPTMPGEYLWTEWNKVVDVYETRAGNLAVKAPNGKTLRIGPRIAGAFIPADRKDKFLNIPAYLRRGDD